MVLRQEQFCRGFFCVFEGKSFRTLLSIDWLCRIFDPSPLCRSWKCYALLVLSC